MMATTVVARSANEVRRVPIGRGVPVHASFWVAAAILTAAMIARVPLGGAAATMIATFVFMVGGMPHGAYDIALLARATALGRRGLGIAVGGYVLVAVAMAVAWLYAAPLALVVFLAAAATHFAEDWTMLDEPLLKIAAGAAILAAPAIAHPAEVTRLFVAMAGAPGGTLIARALVAAAPVALLVTIVGLVAAWRDGARDWAAAMAAAIVLLLVAPPVAGFALFFVFLHSPRHLAATRAALRPMSGMRWLATGAAMSAAAVAGWLAVTGLFAVRPAADLTAQAFQLLAAVAVPHLLLSQRIAARLEGCGA